MFKRKEYKILPVEVKENYFENTDNFLRSTYGLVILHLRAIALSLGIAGLPGGLWGVITPAIVLGSTVC